LYEAVLRDLVKCEASFIFATVEEKFKEGKNAHLLIEVSHFFHDLGEPTDEVLVTLNCGGKL